MLWYMLMRVYEEATSQLHGNAARGKSSQLQPVTFTTFSPICMFFFYVYDFFIPYAVCSQLNNCKFYNEKW